MSSARVWVCGRVRASSSCVFHHETVQIWSKIQNLESSLSLYFGVCVEKPKILLHILDVYDKSIHPRCFPHNKA